MPIITSAKLYGKCPRCLVIDAPNTHRNLSRPYEIYCGNCEEWSIATVWAIDIPTSDDLSELQSQFNRLALENAKLVAINAKLELQVQGLTQQLSSHRKITRSIVRSRQAKAPKGQPKF